MKIKKFNIQEWQNKNNLNSEGIIKEQEDRMDPNLAAIDTRVKRIQGDITAIDRADEFMYALGTVLARGMKVPNIEQALNDTFGKDKSFVQLLKSKMKELAGDPIALLVNYQASQQKYQNR